MGPVSDLGPRAGDAPRLLIVEDEIATVFAMREFFTYTGYQVDCATSVHEAVALLDRNPYAVVITDLHLTPHRCGEGMTVLTSARTRNPHALIVMLTAYASEGSQREASNGGVNLYQTKPVGLAELAARIESGRRQGSRAARTGDGTEWGGACPQ